MTEVPPPPSSPTVTWSVAICGGWRGAEALACLRAAGRATSMIVNIIMTMITIMIKILIMIVIMVMIMFTIMLVARPAALRQASASAPRQPPQIATDQVTVGEDGGGGTSVMTCFF